jgi:hypothetical protein
MMQSLQEFSYTQINETYMNTISNMCFSQMIEHFLKECHASIANNQVVMRSTCRADLLILNVGEVQQDVHGGCCHAFWMNPMWTLTNTQV